jgi:rhodanese-related sulfurtransferase
MTVTVVKPQELARLCKEGKKIERIDVRPPVDLAALMQAHGGSTNEPLSLICRSGSRGQQVCEEFLNAG